ncbi:MAG: aminoacetone oxidase family FAD-binding enzyme [bacterium]
MNVAIIGAGASGVMTALAIKELNKNIKVDLYEKEDRILKKLAATGGGKCNLGNLDINENYFNNTNYIKDFVNDFDKTSYLNYFNKYNLKLTNDNNLLYPYSKTASMVINFFKERLSDTNVNILLNAEVKNIDFKNKLINNKKYDYIVISIGSKALYNNNVYSLLKNDFSITKLEQSLVGFISNQIKDMKEIRQQAKVSLIRNSNIIIEQKGEIQFKNDGLSGICIMNLSAKYQTGDCIEIDFFPNDSVEDIIKKISNKNLNTINCFKYSLENKIIKLINNKNKNIDELSNEQLVDFINSYKKFRLNVNGLYDYKFSQVVRGGVNLKEVNSFESIKYKKVFLTGEILDIDGLCGGYNLWFAFNSGMKVGEDICKYVLEK